jgi:hypothetical protein
MIRESSRMTIRGLIAGLAMVVLLSGCCLFVGQLKISWDDQFDGAESKEATRAWEAGASPKIVIDACDGAIMVKPSLDGRITADVTRHTLCKNLSKAVAEDALRYIHVEMIEEGDIIRIVTRPTEYMPKNNYARTGTYINVSTDIEVAVPEGARLDLRTGVGQIEVVGRPAEIRAKNNAGFVGFDLDPTRGLAQPGDSPKWLKLEGTGGNAEVDFDGSAYHFRGDIKPVPQKRQKPDEIMPNGPLRQGPSNPDADGGT